MEHGKAQPLDGADKPTVFISYSHKDKVWKDRLRPQLEVLQQAGRITLWDDRRIGAGEEWYDEIREAMDLAAVAVCLISADFLSSKFCTEEEIPYLLARRERHGMILIPVLLRPSPWKAVSWLSAIQMIPKDGKSIARDFKDDWEAVFAEVAERIFEILEDPDYRPPAPPAPAWPPPDKLDIDRLPATGAELFGRQKALALLDEAWEADGSNLVSLVAWGGVGKSTLVNKWLERMAAANYRSARRVFGWSFYSQGTGERVTSADQFIATALDWFGDDDPTKGSPWDKGQRLAGLVRKEPTLLVLDGMEPLQSDLDFEAGRIKDPALAILISELARENNGLCVISTREAVADLAPFHDTTREENLEQISSEAGRALLRVGAVRGTDADLEAATRDFGNHALALNLLAAYLRDIQGHHISHAAEIPDLDIPDEKGRHPRRVMAAFEQRFGDGSEVELLRVFGLFDRPAEAEAIGALRTAPGIPDLTANLIELRDGDWRDLLGKLRRAGLMAPKSEHRPDTLDAHPLVREHFGQRLRERHSDAWQQGNNCLYEHYKGAAPELPDTLEEMAPLFAAVAHGCAAGRYQDALDEVYYARIQRDGAFNYCVSILGAIGADTAALSNFFTELWVQPSNDLAPIWKAAVLAWAGFRLSALGRLAEAVEPIQASLDSCIALENWVNGAIAAGNLSELYITIGDLRQAQDFAQQSVDFADKSGSAVQRLFKRTTLANALYQAGRIAEAQALFLECEALQIEMQPDYPFLYSVRGYQYCELLLDLGKYQEVRDRAGKIFELHAPSYSLLSIALDHLSLGRAHLAEAQVECTSDFSVAANHIELAMDGLRQAGRRDEIPRGLLARAALHRVQGQVERARQDLDEALAIAERGGMRLYQADPHLGYARLYVALGKKPKAREHLATAKEMVGSMGYHRRDAEVSELEEQLRG